MFLTQKGLEEAAAQDGRHFAHAGLQGLLLWTGQVGLVLTEQPHRSLRVCNMSKANTLQKLLTSTGK